MGGGLKSCVYANSLFSRGGLECAIPYDRKFTE